MSTEQTGQPCPKCGKGVLTQVVDDVSGKVKAEECKACGFVHDLKDEMEAALKRV
jgi:uncharacterized Zn finger protein